eukprot:7378059-Prymnesium_polylepis.2
MAAVVASAAALPAWPTAARMASTAAMREERRRSGLIMTLDCPVTRAKPLKQLKPAEEQGGGERERAERLQQI